MPRDVIPEQFTETKAEPFTLEEIRTFSPGHEGLRKLAWVLRHPEVWPVTHRWNFLFTLEPRGCGTAGCAIGVASLMWGRTIKPEKGTTAMEKPFALSEMDAMLFFSCADPWRLETYNKPADKIIPSDVADAIDRYLTRALALKEEQEGR